MLPTDTHNRIFVCVRASVHCHPAVTVPLGSVLWHLHAEQMQVCVVGFFFGIFVNGAANLKFS